MYWLLNTYPIEKHVWVQVRILHETDKAILVHIVQKSWIAKSMIKGIRLRNYTFEIYIKGKIVG